MPNPAKWIAYCSLAILVALYVVGAVSNGSLRHEVQTLPLWFPIVLGFRQSPYAKWSALPAFIFWLVLMIFIWLFLLGWGAHHHGSFLPRGDSHDPHHRGRVPTRNFREPSVANSSAANSGTGSGYLINGAPGVGIPAKPHPIYHHSVNSPFVL